MDMISPDFPKKILGDAAASIEHQIPAVTAATGPGGNISGGDAAVDGMPRYHHGSLRVAFYFHIIYEEWLKYIETIFREEGSLDCLSLFRLRAYLDDCRKNWSISFSQPPSVGV